MTVLAGGTVGMTLGDDHPFNLTLTDSTKQPVDITDAVITMTVKHLDDFTTNDDSAVFKYTTTAHTEPLLGRTTITILSADQTGIREYMSQNKLYTCELRYDIQIRLNGLTSSTPTGKFLIRLDTTIETGGAP